MNKNFTSEYSKLDKVYKYGKMAAESNKTLSSNPYPIGKIGSRSQTEFSQWVRGWLTKSYKDLKK